MDAGEIPVVYLPLDHGTSVAPSGLFPTVRRRRGGSLELGMSALKNDLHMMSFIAKWRLARALDCLRGGLLGQLFRRICICVGHKGSGPGGGQLPLGPLILLLLSLA